MIIYLIQDRIHYSNGDTSEWFNLYAERTKEGAERTIARREKEQAEIANAASEEYRYEELRLFD